MGVYRAYQRHIGSPGPCGLAEILECDDTSPCPLKLVIVPGPPLLQFYSPPTLQKQMHSTGSTA